MAPKEYSQRDYENWLMHHGVRGMKWYVRRYQNPDGTLTPLGRKRYAESKSANSDRYDTITGTRNYIADHTKGIQRKADNDYVIKKGTTLGRLSSKKKEAIDDRQKYMYMTKDDRKIYKHYAKEGVLGINTTLHENIFEAKKDLNVASEQKLKDFIIGKWGATKVKNLKKLDDYTNKLDPSIMQSLMNLTIRQVQQEFGSTVPDPATESSTQSRKYFFTLEAAGKNIVQAFTNEKIFSTPMNQLTMKNHFVKLGYDAVIDLEDSIGDSANLPIIMLSPKDSITFTTKKFGE